MEKKSKILVFSGSCVLWIRKPKVTVRIRPDLYKRKHLKKCVVQLLVGRLGVLSRVTSEEACVLQVNDAAVSLRLVVLVS